MDSPRCLVTDGHLQYFCGALSREGGGVGWSGGGGGAEADLSSENGGIGMSSLVCSLRFLIVICTGQSRESTLQRH